MTTPDNALVHEDTALVAVLTEQVGNLNTLVTRFRLRASAAEARASAAEAALDRERAERHKTQAARPPEPLPVVTLPAPANAPVGRGEISVTLDARPNPPLAADVTDFDELLGEVRLL